MACNELNVNKDRHLNIAWPQRLEEGAAMAKAKTLPHRVVVPQKTPVNSPNPQILNEAHVGPAHTKIDRSRHHDEGQ